MDQLALDDAFDRFDRPDVMGPDRRLLLLAGGVTAHGSEPLAAAFFPFALARGAGAEPLAEIVLQTHLFAGYPRTINALFALRAAFGRAQSPSPESAEAPATRAARFRTRGESLCRRIYGSNYDALRKNIRALHPDLDTWMVEEGYGRVLSRPGVDAATRELAALTALVVLHVPRQLQSHLRGARNVGASDAEIELTLDQCAIVAGEAAVQAARAAWRSRSSDST